jgi:peptidoglycan/xylan/chitin deacetylase (PgdA/CDA1 family)
VANWADSPSLNPRLISTTPDDFRRQVDYLASNYEVVSMAEVLEALQHRRRLSPRSVLITFDDAYSDFKDTAWPILRERHLSATVFVPTAYPDHHELCCEVGSWKYGSPIGKNAAWRSASSTPISRVCLTPKPWRL